jgi:O-methyltransferase involved in polyketide biosynthesis
MATDSSKPSVGRIYDYVLGGHHNFEVDREAARQILKILPSYPTWARLNRWFLQMIAGRWAAEAQRNILDLGSGLPTQGHFHECAPNSLVLYSDYDPVTVAYAHEVLGDNPSALYLQADTRDIRTILAAADQFFGGQRKVAIGCIGVAYFVDDTDLARIMRELHAWAAPGSVMALSFIFADMTNPHAQEMRDMYQRNAADVYLRDEAQVRQLCAPWQFQECQPLAAWLEVEHLVQESDREGVNTEMYGALLTHGG